MSSTSSESWNATPNTSPKRVSVSTTAAGAPDSSAPNRALVAISEPVLSTRTLR